MWQIIIMVTRREYVQALDLGIKALNICNNIHERTGAMKVPLIDVANEIGNGTTKKMIQDGFWILVEMEVIGDDGDYDHMNYSDENNELSELLQEIKIEELEKNPEEVILSKNPL